MLNARIMVAVDRDELEGRIAAVHAAMCAVIELLHGADHASIARSTHDADEQNSRSPPPT